MKNQHLDNTNNEHETPQQCHIIFPLKNLTQGPLRTVNLKNQIFIFEILGTK